jgi:hypothetical protein
MTLYELTKMYSTGNDESMMWKTLDVVSKEIEESVSSDRKDKLMRAIFSIISTGHYNEEFAHEDIAKMYYIDENDKKHYAPYWSDSEVRTIYDSVSGKIRGITFWDFLVAINMIKSDDYMMIKQWFPGQTEEEYMKKIVDATLNWLNDEDNPYGKNKIWCYLNPKD